MHPDRSFRTDDRALMADIVREIGFGTVFAATPDGPRVGHTAFHLASDCRLLFHLSRGNALTRHLGGLPALAVVNGPDAYVSPDWYATGGQVPTWNYVAVEMEGPVHVLDRDGLVALLDDLAAANEARLTPKPAWTRAKMDARQFDRMLDGITGFALEVQAWRPTLKLSQNKDAADRAGVADALEAQGQRAIAKLIRDLPA